MMTVMDPAIDYRLSAAFLCRFLSQGPTQNFYSGILKKMCLVYLKVELETEGLDGLFRKL